MSRAAEVGGRGWLECSGVGGGHLQLAPEFHRCPFMGASIQGKGRQNGINPEVHKPRKGKKRGTELETVHYSAQNRISGGKVLAFLRQQKIVINIMKWGSTRKQ